MSNRAIVASLSAAVVSLFLSYPSGAVDDAAAKALAKKSGCLACHSETKTKTGPSYKSIAAKYKGNADAEKTLTAFITAGGKVKLAGGGEADHRVVKSSDTKEVKNLVDWILSQ